jgi:hypothetical protein
VRSSKGYARPDMRKHGFWIVGLCLLLGLGAWAVFSWSSMLARSTAIDRVRTAKQPLTTAELKSTGQRAGKDPAEWLARAASTQSAFELGDLMQPERYAELLQRARAGALGAETAAAFDALEAHFEAVDVRARDVARRELWTSLEQGLRLADGTLEWKRPHVDAVRLLVLGLAPFAPVLESAHEYGSIDPRSIVKQLDDAHAFWPSLPAGSEPRVADLAYLRALERALGGAGARVGEPIGNALACAAIHEPPALLVSFGFWSVHVERALDALQVSLPLIERGVDWTAIEAQLLALRPRETLRAALRVERTFGNRAFELLEHGADDLETLGVDIDRPAWVLGLTLTRDSAIYNETLTDALEALTKPFAARRSEPRRQLTGSWMSPIANGIVPRVDDLALLADKLEARLVLARAALIAYEAGARDALAFLGKSNDPFSGKPVQCALNESGMILLWSVGADGVDDGGSDPTRDIVWRLRLR